MMCPDREEQHAIKSIMQTATGEYRLPGETTREAHLAWCKQRALEELDRAGIAVAFASLASDLSKHPETVEHPGLDLGMRLMLGGFIQSDREMRDHIEGYG